MLLSVVTAANEAASIESAARSCLRDVCDVAEWPLGHLCLLSDDNPGEMLPTGIWHPQTSSDFAGFRRATGSSRFAAGAGLPGRVLSSGRPEWAADITSGDGFPRANAARADGLRGSVALPLLAGGKVVGALEFFSASALEPEETLLEVMGTIGAQLGRVVEREKAAESLRESESRYRSLAQSAGDAIISADGEGMIASWNPGAEVMFGYTEAQALGMPLDALTPGRFRSAHEEAMETALTGGDGPSTGRTVTVQGLKRDGTEFPVEISVGAWTDGDSLFYGEIIRDLSERAGRDESQRFRADVERRVVDRTTEVEQANLRLRREIAERMRVQRENDEFLVMAAHELKTPITSIKGYSQLLLKRGGQGVDEPTAHALRTIDQKADQLARLINDVLDVFRIGSGRLQLELSHFDMARLLDDVCGVARLSWPAFRFSVSLPDGPAWVEADRTRLAQVVATLVENAVRNATSVERLRSPGDSGVDSSDRVELEVRRTGGEVITVVREDGATGSAQRQFRALGHMESAGTGESEQYPYPGMELGLFIAREVVQSHLGRMWTQASDGGGSAFYFALPDATNLVTTGGENTGERETGREHGQSQSDRGRPNRRQEC